ncbi:MAG TPA: hypothetical protein VH762_02995 [Gemmatimonadaceae bacterium]|jgi:hypothetical protein
MKPTSYVTYDVAIAVTIFLAACADNPVTPMASEVLGPGAAAVQSAQAWGPETPNFNLQVILRGQGFGHVKFRQPNDDVLTIHLDTWVRDLAPNTSYLLQRAVDVTVDDDCTSTAWLTLGKGLQPQSITTDDKGTGREELFRTVASPFGSEFDIHFRVIDAATGAVVLTSECYQFKVSL